MKKLTVQGSIIVALFFSVWFVLAQLDWVTLIKVKAVTKKTEKKLGEMFWEIFKNKEYTNPFVITSIDSIVEKICSKNKIDRNLIEIHVLKEDAINAFALPHGHLVIYSGLVLASDDQDELAGVICHEIAHIQLSHVMIKLIREVGLSILISMTTGESKPGALKKIAKILSTSAFDRKLEKQADIAAIDYLATAKINPEALANFLYKRLETEHEITKYLPWVSSHPNVKERAKYIIEYSKQYEQIEFEAILTPATWSALKEQIKNQTSE